MKISKTLGNLGSLVIFIGAIFKIMHWPGANVLIIFGSLFVLIYLLLSLSEAIKLSGNGKEKTFITILTVTLLLQVVFGLFRVMHWPGSGLPFIQILIPLNLVLIIVYFMYLSSENDEYRKSSSVRFLVIYFTLSSYILLRWNSLPGHILGGFSFADQSINSTTKRMEVKNTVMYNKLMNDSSKASVSIKIKEMTVELTKYITDLKIDLVKASKPQDPALDLTKDVNIYTLNNRNDYDTPTAIMLGSDGNEQSGKAAELKSKINTFRENLINLFDGENKVMLNGSIGLTTEGCEVEDAQQLSWGQCNFDHRPLAAVIVTLDQLCNEVRYAESVALQQLLMP